MPRQIITITEDQKSWLQRESTRMGISLTEAIRRLVDAKMEEQAKDGKSKANT